MTEAPAVGRSIDGIDDIESCDARNSKITETTVNVAGLLKVSLSFEVFT